MKKQKIVSIAILVTIALLVISTGVVFAIGLNHGGQPFYGEDTEDNDGAYWGPMHGHRGGWSSGEAIPPMHDAMVQSLVDETGLSISAIEARLAQGEHLIEIAQDAGMADEDFFDLMTETRETFLAEAFESGVISEEHYQWMHEHMEGDAYEPGYGGCHRFDDEGNTEGVRGPGMGRGRRW
jgi:hypothetical protein